MKKSICILLLFRCIAVFSQDCSDLLQNKIEQYYLNLRSKPDSLLYINCTLVQQRLGINDVFLDFLSTTMNNEPVFIVTVIRKTKADVAFVPQLKGHSVSKETSDTTRGISIKSKVNSGYTDYKNLLGYLDPYLENASTIYYSTTGDLNLVNLKCLKTKQNAPLFRKYKMVRLHTAASFLAGKQQLLLSPSMKVLLAGNIAYDCDTTSSKKSSFRNTWNYLPGTKKEIREIATLLEKRHKVRMIDSCNVTETKLLAEVNNDHYDVLHLATHGFYVEDSSEALGVKKESFPLDRSGIVLSGANNTNANVGAFNPYGLFTSSDFLKMRLANIKLVVLSTCHSGEGNSTQSGAPIGLILSLLRQGTTAMIVSNRAVNDNDARLFMSTFYSFLNKNPNADECFTNTLRQLYNTHPEISWDFFDLMH
jgi:CHAT domain-containing protein